MITVSKTSGTANVLDQDDGYYIVILDNFTGTVVPSSDVSQLKIFLYRNCIITNDIELRNHNKLDRIEVTGKGNLTCGKLHATTVELYSDVIASGVSGNVIRVEGRSLKSKSSGTTFMYAKGHIWCLDCIIRCSGYSTFTHAPYTLYENVDCEVSVSSKVFDTKNLLSIEFCKNLNPADPNTATTSFACKPLKTDSSGQPIYFAQLFQIKSKDSTELTTRRKIHKYEPAQLATPYDFFKESTGYTNVNLHRRIDQEGEILKAGIDLNAITPEVVQRIIDGRYDLSLAPENLDAITKEVILAICNDPDYVIEEDDDLFAMATEIVQAIIDGRYIWFKRYIDGKVQKYDRSDIDLTDPNYIVAPKTNDYAYDEVHSRQYEVGIYGLNSYRTTEIFFHDDASPLEELP